MRRRGRVLTSYGGHQRVLSDGREVLAVPRGRLRRDGGGILPGDDVEIEDDVIVGVLPRRNRLDRPGVANVDTALVVVTLVRPAVTPADLDRRLASVARAGVRAAVLLNKADLLEEGVPDAFLDAYRTAGYGTAVVSALTGAGIDAVPALLGTGTAVLTGPSGTGKSTLLGRLAGLKLRTGEVSRADRGRHTTTGVELFPVGSALVADTPGFAALSLPPMTAEEVAGLFPDVEGAAEGCRFTDCRHLKEPGCAVRRAVEEGRLAKSRYASYAAMIEEVKPRW